MASLPVLSDEVAPPPRMSDVVRPPTESLDEGEPLPPPPPTAHLVPPWAHVVPDSHQRPVDVWQHCPLEGMQNWPHDFSPVSQEPLPPPVHTLPIWQQPPVTQYLPTLQ